VDEAALYLHTSVKTVRKELLEGRLRYHKIGRCILIARRWLDEWQDEQAERERDEGRPERRVRSIRS
jgi:excisionase family DNA binding protein